MDGKFPAESLIAAGVRITAYQQIRPIGFGDFHFLKLAKVFG